MTTELWAIFNKDGELESISEEGLTKRLAWGIYNYGRGGKDYDVTDGIIELFTWDGYTCKQVEVKLKEK